MDRRDFFGCIGKMLMVGAVTVVAPELMQQEITEIPGDLVEILPDGSIRPWAKPDFMLAA